MITCPIDEHLCTRKECVTSLDYPNCLQVVSNIGFSLAHLMKAEDLLGLNPEEDTLSIDQELPLLKAAKILGVDLARLSERVSDDISGAGSSYMDL